MSTPPHGFAEYLFGIEPLAEIDVEYLQLPLRIGHRVEKTVDGFEVSVILIVLRQILEDFDSNPTESQASDKYVTATEIKEEAELFLPATFNRAKFEKDLDRYIDSIAGFGFLVEAKHIEGEKRYKIHRIIKDKVTLDDILEFKNKLNDYNAADEPI